MKKYRVLAFDMDNTLVDDTKARKYAIAKTVEAIGIPYTEELGKRYLDFDNAFWHSWETGKIKIPDNTKDWVKYIRSKRFQLFFKEHQISMDKAEVLNQIYSESLENCIMPFDGAYETLNYLKNYYKLAIVTNGVKKLINKKLDIIKVKSFISYIACAEEIGVNKPHKQFFDAFLQICNCTKEEVLIIGDSLSSDILGGMKNGIDTCWFNPSHLPLPAEYYPTMEIDALPKLTRRL